MKKKILGIIIIVVLAGFLFIAGSAVILFLAPGTEIFGIRYVSLGSSKCNVTEPIVGFVGENIYVETNGVPITIEFTEYYASQVQFSQNFAGFTKSDYDKADVNVYTDEEGNLHIETHEIVKWLFAYETDKTFALNIKLSALKNANKNLVINSNESSVEFIGNAVFTNFNMSSQGSLNLNENSTITAENFKYHTSKQINVDENIKAKNFDLYSSGSSINLQYASLGDGLFEVGDIKAETKSGDIRFISCYNLNAKSSSGNIRCYGEGLNSVKNNVNIETVSGNITLGNVNTNEMANECKITTMSGDVSISTLKDGNIVCERGDVNVDTANNLVITGKVGKINVQQVKDSIVVKGRNGDVSLGASGSLNNVHVTTTTGKIDVKNVYSDIPGEVYLDSESNTVNLKLIKSKIITDANKKDGSKSITIKAGRNLTASGLEGKVYAYANGDINLSFYEIFDNVTIDSGTKVDNINIEVEKTPLNDINYDLQSSKGEYARVYIGDKLQNEGSKIKTDTLEDKPLIKVETSYAKIFLKFAI